MFSPFKYESMYKVLLKRKYVDGELDWIQQERGDELDLKKNRRSPCV